MKVHAFPLQQLAIAIKISRILGQVFVGAELQGIHEDRDHHQIALGLGHAHQREMAFVQRAHGGHQAHGLALAQRGAAGGTHFFDGVADFHDRRWPSQAEGTQLMSTCMLSRVPATTARLVRIFTSIFRGAARTPFSVTATTRP